MVSEINASRHTEKGNDHHPEPPRSLAQPPAEIQHSLEARTDAANLRGLGPQLQGELASRGSHEIVGRAELASRAYRTEVPSPGGARPPEFRPGVSPQVGTDNSMKKGGKESVERPAQSAENVPKNDNMHTGGPASAEEQRIIHKLGQEAGATVILFATEERADLRAVAGLIEKGIDPDKTVNWISDHVDLPSVATLLDKGVDEGRVTVWLSRGDNLSELTVYMVQDVSTENALQLVRSGMESSTTLPLIQEGIAPQTILGILKTGVSPQDVSSTIEQHVATLIQDGKTSFRLTEPNAIWALNGPEGTYARVSGPDNPGADVRFINSRTGDVELVRELKSVSTAKGFDTQIRSLRGQLANEDGVKEALFQVPRGTNAESWVGGFRDHRHTDNLSSYKRIHIIVNDPDGKQLWHGYLG